MAKVKNNTIQYKYNIVLKYLNNKGSGASSVDIKTESIKMLTIDYDFDADDCMPVIFANLNLDKSFVDHMVEYANDNLFMMAIQKYDDLSETKEKIECFREKFVYFLPNDVNKNDQIDYNEDTQEENGDNTYQNVTIGMICLKHINLNRNFNKPKVVKKNTMYEIVQSILSKHNDILIEPFDDNKKFDSLILPDKDSVNKELAALNDYRVFYDTPYRFFYDFDCAYLVSSSGKAITRQCEKYGNIIVQIKDIMSDEANDVGFTVNNGDGVYQVPVSYADTQIFDNTVANKSKNNITGKTSDGKTNKRLNNQASYTKSITSTVRINNENEGMLDNIKADQNSNNFFIYFSKAALDIDLFTINKKITVKNIDRYNKYDGKFLLYRKRDMFILEDNTFSLMEMINLRRIEN